jgi:glycopeptide antibiotics resistance protein
VTRGRAHSGQDHLVSPPTASLGSTPTRRLLVALFAVYLLLLVWIILWKLEIPYVGAAASQPRPVKLVPYLPSGDFDASDPLEVVVNILLFVPFGIYLGMLAPRLRWWAVAGVLIAASLVLETTQHLLSVGSFDVTDVIDNTLGGLIGFGALVLARRKLGVRAGTIVTRVCLIGGVIAVLAVAAFMASPLRFVGQQDVIVPRPDLTRSPSGSSGSLSR